MRLWHQELISYLPRQQLLGQHREICALRGLGWGKPHSIINYVFDYPYDYLYQFHVLVMIEMEKRGYHVDPLWKMSYYRGKNVGDDRSIFTERYIIERTMIYPEHNQHYYKECIDNLESKGVHLNFK